MARRSIRFRLTVWYAAILTAGLGLFAGALWVSMRARLRAEIDRDLESRAAQFERYFRSEAADTSPGHLRGELEEFCQALPAASYITLVSDRGYKFHFPATGPTPAERYRKLQHKFTLDGEMFNLESGYSVAEMRHTLDLLRLLLLSLLPAVIAVACAGGWWLSGRALKPVQRITGASRAPRARARILSRLPAGGRRGSPAHDAVSGGSLKPRPRQ
jgi:hypothetical protein